MNKIISVVVIAMSLGVAGSALAADNDAPFTGNVKITADDTGCPMLAGDVTLGVSANVHGMWVCDEQYNVVKVGACHEGGTRSPAVCAWLPGTDGLVGTSDDVLNYTTCTEADIGKIPTGQDPDYNAYVIGSGGGSIAGVALGGRCDATSLPGLDFF